MGNLNEQIDRIKQMILFKEGMNFKDVRRLTEADKEGVENGADVEAVGGSPSVKSAAASNGADVAADGGGGVEMADVVKGDKGVEGKGFDDKDAEVSAKKMGLPGGELMDEIPAYAITNADGEKIGEIKGGEEGPDGLPKGIEDVAAKYAKGADEVDEKVPDSNFPKDEDEDAKSAAKELAKDFGFEVIEKEMSKEEEAVAKDKEKAAKDAAKEPRGNKDKEAAKDAAKEPKEKADKEEEVEKTPDDEIIAKAEEEVELSEKESLHKEIVSIQEWMIGYLEDGGDKGSDVYQDMSQHHQQLMDEYEDMQQAGLEPPPKIIKGDELGSPTEPTPAERDIHKASTGGMTYEIDMDLGGSASQQGMIVGTPKLSIDKEGNVTLKANVTQHEEYPTPATLEGYMSDGGEVFYLNYITDNGEEVDRYKAEIMGTSKSGRAKPTLSKSPSRVKGPTGTRASGAYVDKLAPFNQSPSQSNKKTTKIKKGKEDKKKKKLSERRYARRNAHYSPQSRGPKVINLKETDLYQIIERVIKEKKSSKRQTIKEEDWMRDVSKEIKKDHTGGSFRRWCESKGYDSGCSDECINDALHTDNTLLHYRAGLAKAFCEADHHRNESRRPQRTLQEKKNWSSDVDTKWSPPEGTFTQSAAHIEGVLKRAPGGLKKAVERLAFYINRGGKNLSASEKRKLNGLKRKIKKDREPIDKDSK